MFPPQAGGSGRWFWELYRRLSRQRYMVAAGHCPGDAAFDATHDLCVERMPLKFASWGVVGAGKLRAYAQAARRLRKIVATNNAIMLHAGCCLPEGFLAWWIARRTSLPYLVYVHGEELEVALTSRELTWMTRRVLGGARAIIANSHNTAAILQDQWQVVAPRLHVVHPGVDIEKFRPAPFDAQLRQSLGWAERSVILTVGRLQQRKGHDVLLQALPEIRRQIPNVLYAIVGDGPERMALERLVAELGLKDSVQFLGELQDDKIVPCYQQSDLFVLPNREVDGDFEGFGIVLLEAQACGKPVIAGASGGTVETLEPGVTGLVLDCRQPGELAGQIPGLLGDFPRRQQMGDAARQWTETRFGWDPIAAAADTLFNSLAGAQPVAQFAGDSATAEKRPGGQ